MERRRFESKKVHLAQAESEIESGRLKDAYTHLIKAIYLEDIKHDPDLISRLVHHHNEVLGKILTLAELREKKLSNLPELEALLEQRLKLLATSYRLKEKEGSVNKKWAGEHYRDQRVNLLREMQENFASIQRVTAAIEEELASEEKNAAPLMH